MFNSWVLPLILDRNGGDVYGKERFFNHFFNHYHLSTYNFAICKLNIRKVPNLAMN